MSITTIQRWSMAVALFSITGLSAQAQQVEVNPNPDVVRTVLGPIERSGVVDMTAQVADDWDPFLKTVVKVHEPGIDARKDKVRAEKQAANALKAQLMAEGKLFGNANQKTTATLPPTLGTNFFGNSYGGGDPADNAMGISAEGKIFSGCNSRVHSYDSTGSQLSSQTFGQFAAAGGVSTLFTFDPKITYDVDADRFVAAFINGASSSSSRIIIGFSQTNNPAGSWNVYAINGNVNNLGVWTDFIQLGLSSQELFVSGNPFTNAGSSMGAAIWQIDKAAGYAGNTLNPVLHYVSTAFSLHPVEGGATLYGPNMYFLESDLGSSSTINLHQMTNTASNNGVLNSPLAFTLDNSYSIPADADQKGTNINLKTNDTRVQSSYFENNRIEFVLNTGFGGKAGVYHGTGVISPFLLAFSSFTGRIVNYNDIEIAYGSIGYAGQQDVSGFNHSYIGFNLTGPETYPGMGGCYVDEAGFSPYTLIRQGVDFINSSDDRWGDYADLQERPGKPGEVWVAGTIGNSNRQQRTYIGQLLPPTPVANTPVIDNGAKLDIYPNPSTDRVVFEFPVDEAGEYKVFVRDLEGRTVKFLIENWLQRGTAKLAFNTEHLAAGTYIISVENESKRLFNERLVVQH